MISAAASVPVKPTSRRSDRLHDHREMSTGISATSSCLGARLGGRMVKRSIVAKVVAEATVQFNEVPSNLPFKMGQFYCQLRELSRVRSTESSGFMELAMGIEPTSAA